MTRLKIHYTEGSLEAEAETIGELVVLLNETSAMRTLKEIQPKTVTRVIPESPGKPLQPQKLSKHPEAQSTTSTVDPDDIGLEIQDMKNSD